MRAAAYIRVSSIGQNLELQQHAINQAAALRGDTLATEDWHIEKRSANTIDGKDRPVLDALRTQIRSGALQRLYVYRLDRLTRSGIADTFQLVNEIRAAHVDLVTISDGFSLDGPAADITLAVMAWAAKMESLARSERQAAASAAAKARGSRLGRHRRMTAEQIEAAQRLRQQKRSLRQIASALKVPLATIGRALKQTSPHS